MSKIFCLIWLDLFNFSPQATPFVWSPLGQRSVTKSWEGYGRVMGGIKKIPPVLKPFVQRHFQRLWEG